MGIFSYDVQINWPCMPLNGQHMRGVDEGMYTAPKLSFIIA